MRYIIEYYDLSKKKNSSMRLRSLDLKVLFNFKEVVNLE